LPDLATAKQLAYLFGISTEHVRRHQLAGVVFKKGRDKYLLRESIRGYCEHLRGVAAGRGGDSAVQTLTAERSRQAKEHADHTALKNAALRKELVPAGDVVRGWSEILTKVRAAMLAVPSRVWQQAPHLTAEDKNLIDAELRLALTALGEAQ
jgi:phage terminase Nu1 subunit (DNA packaging protein)